MTNQPPAILQLIGNTPLVEITRIDTGPCRLFAKLESQNPGGSIKDRIARQMIAEAEKEGKLKPGGTIVEATAGNTGLGLTLIGGLKGYKVILVVPDKMSREKIFHCKAMGADVRVVRSDVVRGHPEYYQDVAERIARETGGFYVNQFGNPANVAAHFEYTGPEILQQMEGDVDAVVCGVGSGGTLTGIGKYMQKHSAKTEMVLADPIGSILAPLVNEGRTIEPGSWLVEGIGEDFIPDILDMALIKKAYAVSDQESLATARELLMKEGILAGPSSGTLAAAAIKYCREQTEPKRVVTLICDRGDKYLSKTFSDFWLSEQGFTPRKPTGTIEDLVMRRHDSGDTVFVRAGDTIKTAYKRMRFADVSQLPVLDEASRRLIGVVDEKSLLRRMTAGEQGNLLSATVGDVMREAAPALPKDTPIETAAPLLQQGSAIMVVDDDRFIGVVTSVDMLNHFYLKGQVA